MSKNPEKQYGLILPNKQKKPIITPVLKKPSIFESDSDSDTAEERPTGISHGLRRQDKEIQNKAIEEDPTIYQYDELYDDMAQKRSESKLSRKDLDKKPKYISNLLKAAEKRKLENERRIERQVQRERETEGNEFKDKEQFVTSSYKKKLEEMRAQEELDKREEYLEAIGDVTKQGNLDGFYRHLYEQKVNYDADKEKKMEEIKTTIKIEENVDKTSENASNVNTNQSNDDANQSNDSSNQTSIENFTKFIKIHEVKEEKPQMSKTQRQYRRKHSESHSDESEEEENVGKQHLPSNLDADSDFSIDSSSSDDEDDKSQENGEPKAKISKRDDNSEDSNLKLSEKSLIGKSSGDKTKESSLTAKNVEELSEIVSNGDELKVKIEEKKETKPKIDIWKKRTVGAVFDAALQRYYERKALRGAA